MTDNVTMNPDDRALWDRYVRLRRGAPSGAGEREPIFSGSDAVLIAAYLDHRLDEWERAAFERRLVDEPILLDQVIVARDTAHAPEVATPQAVSAYALNLAAVRPAPAHQLVHAARRRRRGWFLPAPAFAWSLATAAFLAAFVAGAFLTWQITEPPAMAQKDPIKDELRPGTNSIFDDPAKTIFDGMDTHE